MLAQPLQEDAVVPISDNMAKTYGPGKMLLPSPATVKAILQNIPAQQLVTIELLRERLAEQFNVEATCPFNTKLCLRAIANDPESEVPYWRVVRGNGELLAYYPGGTEGHAARLREEGVTVDSTGETPKVKKVSHYLMQFDRV